MGPGTGLLDKRIEECPYYERGFCKFKPINCGLAHMFRKICPNYVIGFCPKGPECELEHIKSIISDASLTLTALANFPEEENWADKSAVAAMTG